MRHRGGQRQSVPSLLIILHGRSLKTVDPRPYNNGTEHVRFSHTRHGGSLDCNEFSVVFGGGLGAGGFMS